MAAIFGDHVTMSALNQEQHPQAVPYVASMLIKRNLRNLEERRIYDVGHGAGVMEGWVIEVEGLLVRLLEE